MINKKKGKLTKKYKKLFQDKQGGNMLQKALTVTNKIAIPKGLLLLKKTLKNIQKKKVGGYDNKNTKSQYCSPDRENKDFTCFTKKSLVLIANELNAKTNHNININTNKYNLWNQIKNAFDSDCDTEWCWIKQQVIKQLNNNEINNTFRPSIPKSWDENDREWLTTVDIDEVLSQYKEKYNDFIWIGPVPIDFDSPHNMGGCVVDELCNISVKRLFNHTPPITKLGIVFNLDKHNQPGSHWVALYADFKKGQIYYYDSYGVKEPNQVTILMDRLEKQVKKIKNFNNFDRRFNKKRHQYKDSECGVYSMMFIIRLLQGESFDDVTQQGIHDDDMQQNRYYLYRPNASTHNN